jgi:long-chain acyl-CoA synthetase
MDAPKRTGEPTTQRQGTEMSEVPSFDQAVAMLTTAAGSPFEITEGEINGQKLKIFANLPSSLRESFDLTRLHGDKTFLVYEDETWTFADVMRRVDEIADALVNRYGIERGDRVAIAMRN